MSAIALAAFFLALGLGVLWFAREVLDLAGGDALLIALLLLPVLLYLALSGRIAEVTGPGGTGAKFREVAATPVRVQWTPVSAQNPRDVPKLDLQYLHRVQQQLLTDERPVVLTFSLGTGHRYGLQTVRRYVEALSTVARLALVVFLDPGERVVGYIPADRFAALVSREQIARQLVSALNAPDSLERLATTPGVVTETLPAGATNAQALRTMTDKRLDAMVLVDESGRSQGVVERVRVLSEMLLAAAP